MEKGVAIARDADMIILALGAGWNSDGEEGDRGTMELSRQSVGPCRNYLCSRQTIRTYSQGCRPFADPDY